MPKLGPLLAVLVPALARAAPIDEQGFVKIGGIEQWVAIQGDDRDNPALLFLHGGPAEAQSSFLDQFRPWEHEFVVVNWDQRGSGKTFEKNGAATPKMTPEQLVADAIDVAEHVRKRLHRKKILLVGQSWGAVLGMEVVSRRPDLFAAFVGTGHPITWVLGLEAREKFAREQAEQAHDAAALKALDEVAALSPTDTRRLSASQKLRWGTDDLAYLNSVEMPFFDAHSPAAEACRAGSDFSGPKLWPKVTGFDARKLRFDPKLPFFVIQGRDDHIVSVEAARRFVEALPSRTKAFVEIDGGHFACFTNPAGFVAALVKLVKPVQ